MYSTVIKNLLSRARRELLFILGLLAGAASPALGRGGRPRLDARDGYYYCLTSGPRYTTAPRRSRTRFWRTQALTCSRRSSPSCGRRSPPAWQDFTSTRSPRQPPWSSTSEATTTSCRRRSRPMAARIKRAEWPCSSCWPTGRQATCAPGGLATARGGGCPSRRSSSAYASGHRRRHG